MFSNRVPFNVGYEWSFKLSLGIHFFGQSSPEEFVLIGQVYDNRSHDLTHVHAADHFFKSETPRKKGSDTVTEIDKNVIVLFLPLFSWVQRGLVDLPIVFRANGI